MMVDSEERQANDRMREERRGREEDLFVDTRRENESRRESERNGSDGRGFPAGPRGRDDYYDRAGPRSGGYGGQGYGYGGRGGGSRDGYAPRGPGGGRYDGRERGYGRGWRA